MANARPGLSTAPHPITGGLGRRELLTVIGAFCIFALGFGVVIGALYLARGLSGSEVVWSRRVATPPAPKLPPRPLNFALAGVKFGIATATLERQQPGTRFNAGRSGKTVGSFRRDGGSFTVGFLPASLGGTSYQIRYQQTFAHYTEDAVLTQLGRRFGRPATSDCKRKDVVTAAPCHFRWFPEQAVRVDAWTRRVANGTGSGTELTLLASDTVAEGQLTRAAEADGRELSPLGRLLEKLPF